MSEVCETGKSRLQLSGVLISLRRLFAFLEVKTCKGDLHEAAGAADASACSTFEDRGAVQAEIDYGSQGGPCDPSTQNDAGGNPAP